MDTVKKEKIIQDARNMFIIAIYSLQVRLRPQLLRTSYTNLLLKKTICNGKTICTVNFHIIHAAVLISFLYLFTFWLLPKMWLAKRPRCPAISCSWAATRLASTVAFLISLAFCINFSSFSFSSFSFFSNSFFPLFYFYCSQATVDLNLLLWGQLQKRLTHPYSFSIIG